MHPNMPPISEADLKRQSIYNIDLSLRANGGPKYMTDLARMNTFVLSAQIKHAIQLAKMAAPEPGVSPIIKGVWSESEVNALITRSNDMMDVISSDDEKASHPPLTTIHRDLVCFFSSYYCASLKGNFLEADHNTIILDMSNTCCRIFVNWHYTGFLPQDDPWDLCQLYILADQIDNLALRRAIMTQLVDVKFTPSHTDADTAVLLNSLPVNSPLTRYLLDRAVHHKHLACKDEECHPDMPADFIAKLKKIRPEPSGSFVECPCCDKPCNYHEHNSEREWENSCGESWFPKPEQGYLAFVGTGRSG